MTHEQKLIADYLASEGTIKVFSEAEEVCLPYDGPKVTTEPSMLYDRKGKRIYKYLNKLNLSASLDETKLNYGN